MPKSISNYLDVFEVDHFFARNKALSAISLSIDSCGITALLGNNGAGKSTFIHSCLGLITPSKGNISVLGHAAGSNKAKLQIGVMLQDTALTDQLSAREQLNLFASYYPNSYTVDDIISSCQLDVFANKRYSKLSGGQKRRVQFAIAIIGKPKLLFLDEPTTGLDAESRKILWRTIRSLADTGTAIVLTTHYLEEAEALADRVIALNQGKVIADAAIDDFKSGLTSSCISCISRLSPSEVCTMTAVKSARNKGRYLQIISDDSAQTLSELLPADPDIDELNVSKSSLEEAFNQLTDNLEQDNA